MLVLIPLHHILPHLVFSLHFRRKEAEAKQQADAREREAAKLRNDQVLSMTARITASIRAPGTAPNKSGALGSKKPGVGIAGRAQMGSGVKTPRTPGVCVCVCAVLTFCVRLFMSV